MLLKVGSDCPLELFTVHEFILEHNLSYTQNIVEYIVLQEYGLRFV